MSDSLTTRVANRRDIKADGVTAFNIMRPSIHGNPFNVDEYGREESIRLHRIWFFNKIRADARYKAETLKMRGAYLVCCCKPKACHGDTIASWLDGFLNDNGAPV